MIKKEPITITQAQFNNLVRRLATIESDLAICISEVHKLKADLDFIKNSEEYLPLTFVAEKTNVKEWNLRNAITQEKLKVREDYIMKGCRYFVKVSSVYEKLFGE